MYSKNIFDLITSEENSYKAQGVQVVDGLEFKMFEHIQTTTLYKNSTFKTGKNDDKPFKNIIRPILNLAYRAEGFDVKDIQLFIDDSYKYFKSFLVKKFHEKWARENKIDTFIDDMVETYVDYGGVLVKNVNEVSPEVVPWQRIVFCDQTDILSGTIAEKHYYSPDQLKEMESKGWKNIDDVIDLSNNWKQETSNNQKQSQTPGKYIEVYEIHGMFPKSWLKKGKNFDKDPEEYEEEEASDYVRQIHIVTFYKSKDSNTRHGITLFCGKESELPYKFIARDKIYGRTLGMGGAEELFEAQVWINYDQIRIKGMLDAAAKVLYQTTDEKFANRNKTSNLENGEILVLQDGKAITQVNTFPVNVNVFENSIKEWEAHARQTGAANESIMGESPTSGTPFKLQELITAESHSLHEYRKGKLATFLDEVYQDWIIPHIVKEITKGQEFLAELELDELQQVADSLVICEANKAIKEAILRGEIIYPDEVELFKQKVRDSFMKGGNKKFLEILKDEMKDVPVSVYVNIVGKQKDLAKHTDKLVNVFRQILAAPGVLDDPRMSKIFNQILEASGLSPIDFYQKPKPQIMQPQQGAPGQPPVMNPNMNPNMAPVQ